MSYSRSKGKRLLWVSYFKTHLSRAVAFILCASYGASASAGGAALTWTAPTQRIGGRVLSNLAGYYIHYGTNRSVLHKTLRVANPSVSTYLLDNLAPGTYYFAVRAYTATGELSSVSNIVAKVVN